MTYPILKVDDANAVAWKLTNFIENSPNSAEYLKWEFDGLESLIAKREGGDWDEVKFLAAARLFHAEVSEDKKDKNYSDAKLEEHFAEHIYQQSKLVSDRALQDPDFWRFLTLFPYRQYTKWRQGDFAQNRYGGSGNREFNRWTLVQGFLLGNRSVVDGDFTLVSAYRNARLSNGLNDKKWVLDFHANNVVRRRWSSWPAAARAFVKATIHNPPLLDKSNSERPTPKFGSLVGRESENVYFPALDEDDMTSIFRGIKERYFPTE